jgi:hypothetical protein
MPPSPESRACTAIGRTTPATVASGRLRRQSSAAEGSSISGAVHHPPLPIGASLPETSP